MIHYSSMEGFSSPPSNGLLILGVKGSVIFEELDLRVRLTPMRFFCGDSKIQVQKMRDKKNEDDGKKEAVFPPYVLQANFSL